MAPLETMTRIVNRYDAPTDSLFEKKLKEKELRYFEKMRARAPQPVGMERRYSASEVQAFQRWALQAQGNVLISATMGGLFEDRARDLFQHSIDNLSGSPSQWTVESAAAAGVVGTGLLAINGYRGRLMMGGFRLGLNIMPGLEIMRASAASGLEMREVASFTLEPRGLPLSLKTQWGLSKDRVGTQLVSLQYLLRY